MELQVLFIRSLFEISLALAPVFRIMKLLLLCTLMVCVSSKYEDIPCSFDGTNRFVQPNSSSGASNVGKTSGSSRASDFGKSYSYREQSDLGKSNSHREASDLGKSNSYREQSDLGKSNSHREASDLGKSNSHREPSDLGKSNSHREPSDLGKSNSHREPSDLGKSNSHREPSDLGKSNSHREPSDLGKSNSHREPSDLGKSSSYSDYNLDTNTSSSSSNISCGLTNSQKTRVVGGQDAIELYLWAVLLYLIDYICGGSIITVFHILSATHCFKTNLNLTQIKVYVDTRDRGNLISNNEYKVEKIIRHEEYESLGYDIAILVIEGRIKFNENVGPVCLPKERIDLPGKQVKILGWGNSQRLGDRRSSGRTDILQEIDVEVSTDVKRCRRERIKKVEGDPEFCKVEGKNGSCKGDSGGPVVYHDTVNNRYIQVGLVCQGSGPCGTTGNLARFSDVYYYKDWITEKVSSTGDISEPGGSPCWV